MTSKFTIENASESRGYFSAANAAEVIPNKVEFIDISTHNDREMLQRVISQYHQSLPANALNTLEGSAKWPRLDEGIRKALAPTLRDDGFVGHGRTFRRVIGTWIHIVNVQGARAHGREFAINLSMHPLALPDASSNSVNPTSLLDWQCAFRTRLSETETHDQWWWYGYTNESLIAAIESAAAMYLGMASSDLLRLTSLNSGLNTVQAADIANGTFDLGCFGTADTFLARNLGRLRRIEGRFDEAQAFEEYGLVRN